MWELDYKESWTPKNWCFWTLVLEKTLESPLDCKIKPVNPKGNQSWIFTGRTDAETETPILLPPDAENWLIGKDPSAVKDWRQEEKGQQRMRWMSSPTQWTWVWASSGNWWWTGKPGMLQSIGLQRVGHNWATEINLSLNDKMLTVRVGLCLEFDRWVPYPAQGWCCICAVSDSLQPHGLYSQTPLSMGISGHDYWSKFSFSSPGDLPDPEIEPASPAYISSQILDQSLNSSGRGEIPRGPGLKIRSWKGKT